MQLAKSALVLSLLSVPAVAQENPGNEAKDTQTDIVLLTGLDYVTGDVDGQEYETTAAMAGLAVYHGRLSVSASIPYVRTTAPEDLIVSNGGLLGTPLFSQPTTETREVTRDGIGDLAVQAGYQIPLGSMDAFVAGNIKIPTASREEGLGTGEIDYGVSGQLSRRFDAVIPFIGASYTVMGEPDGFDVRNTLSATAGSQFVVGETSSVTLSYNYEQSATENFSDRQSVGVGLATGIASNVQLGVDARAGLSGDAPDARLGMRLGFGF